MKEDSVKKILFVSAFLIVLIMLVICIFVLPDVIKDCVFVMIMIILFYFLEKKYPLPIPIIIFGLIPMVLDPIGVTFGFFNLYPFGIGYDKFIHFTFSLLGTIVVFHILRNITKKQVIAIIITAVLVVNGVGVLSKLTEFAGSRYIGFYGPTMFSEGDGIPPADAIQEMITYDPWWDLIFGMMGTITAGAILLVAYRKHY